MIDRAIVVAAQAHKGQVDKGGHPYILHPLRVMLRVTQKAGDDGDAQIAAVLHDVLEDSPMLARQLKDFGFSDASVKAVVALTRKPYEAYDEFIDRVKKNPIARLVKLADLEDNMDLSRLSDVTEKDLKRVEKYRKAHQILSAAD